MIAITTVDVIVCATIGFASVGLPALLRVMLERHTERSIARENSDV